MSRPDLTSDQPRWEVEHALASIWSQVLGHTDFGIYDSFLSVGGGRDQVAPLLAAIRREFGFTLAPADIERSPTLSSMALLLRGASDSGRARVLVTMKKVGEGRTAVCFPPIGGGVSRYTRLARQLKACNVYGLQSAGLNPQCAPDETVEAMADRYATELGRIGDLGAGVVFLGFSMGGVIALETAKIYAARGGPLPSVALIDAPPRYGSPEDAGLDFRMFVHEVLLLDVTVGEEPPENWPAELDRVHDEAVDRGLLPRSFSRSLLHRIFNVYVANASAAARYRPSYFPHDITLYRCSAGEGDPDDMGWANFARGVRLVALPTEHYRALENVELLAEDLDRLFARS